MNLFRIMYGSRLMVELKLSEMVELADRAAAYNAALGITGFLAFGDGQFLQVLEGGQEAVNRVYHTRVLADARHSHFRLLTATGIDVRRFSEWGMGFAAVRAEDRALIRLHFPEERLDIRRVSAAGALEFLAALSARSLATRPPS